jgi:hypothetical protein
LALALCSLLLGLFPWDAYLSILSEISSNLLTFKTVPKALWPILAGGVVAILIGSWTSLPARISFGAIGPIRRSAVAFAKIFERLDNILRQWPAAGISLLVLALLITAALLAPH